jgi:hypothetical protein
MRLVSVAGDADNDRVPGPSKDYRDYEVGPRVPHRARVFAGLMLFASAAIIAVVWKSDGAVVSVAATGALFVYMGAGGTRRPAREGYTSDYGPKSRRNPLKNRDDYR